MSVESASNAKSNKGRGDGADPVCEYDDYAAYLAEHCDVLIKVAHGDLNARMPENSQIKLFQSLASGTNQLIATVQAEIEYHKRVEKWIHGLNRMKDRLLEPGSLSRKFKCITDSVVETFDADFARIWIIKPGDLCDSGCIHAEVKEGPHVCRHRDRCLHLVASSGRYTHIDGKTHRRVPFGCYKIGRVAAGDDAKFITNNVTTDPRVHNNEWAKECGLVSFAGYRILSVEGVPSGVLALFAKHEITNEEDSFLETLAGTVSHILQIAHLAPTNS
jgi:hypothetical protein